MGDKTKMSQRPSQPADGNTEMSKRGTSDEPVPVAFCELVPTPITNAEISAVRTGQMAAEAGKTNKVIAITHPQNLESNTRGLPDNTWHLVNSLRTDGWGGGTPEQPGGATVATLDLLRTSSHPKVIVLGGGRVAAQETAIYHTLLGHIAEFEIVAVDIPRSNGDSCYGVLAAEELGYPVEPLNSQGAP